VTDSDRCEHTMTLTQVVHATRMRRPDRKRFGRKG
jgi:hypothetical protein